MTKPSVVVVIDPGTGCPEIEDFNNISTLSRLPCTYHPIALYGANLLPDPKWPLAGIIILGSSANPNLDLTWQTELCQWLAATMAAKIPTLGLCYGHQLLAHLNGGTVSLRGDDATKHEGCRQIELTGYLGTPTSSLSLVISHRDEVTQLPPAAHVMAASPSCRYEALYYPDTQQWSFQGHPEATNGFIRNQQISLQEKESVTAMNHGHSVVQAFLDHCHNHHNNSRVAN